MIPLPTTPEDDARIVQACISKAARILALAEAPLGVWGEITEMGMAETKPDYQIRELLFGFHYGGIDVLTITADVTTEMVITQGLQTDPATFPVLPAPGCGESHR